MAICCGDGLAKLFGKTSSSGAAANGVSSSPTLGWTSSLLDERVHDGGKLSSSEKSLALKLLNDKFPVNLVDRHLEMRRKALSNLEAGKTALAKATQSYPRVVNVMDVDTDAKALQNCTVVFTAGGEGERLRVSLQKESGLSDADMADFTKATWPLKGSKVGALVINLRLLADIQKKNGFRIPVVVTTGPEGSLTWRVIGDVLRKNDNFGLDVYVVMQDERVHFTQDEKVCLKQADGGLEVATQPDETGGPIMKLREPIVEGSSVRPPVLETVLAQGKSKVIVLQGTAVYKPELLVRIANAAKTCDALGVGIARTAFPEDDPYGTFVEVAHGGKKEVVIIEKAMRNDKTRSLKGATGQYLPFNTGFYAFDGDLLMKHGLPEYCTPPKEVRKDLAKSAKCGYAATDLLPLGASPAILTVPEEWFGVIKEAPDLAKLGDLLAPLGLRSYA